MSPDHSPNRSPNHSPKHSPNQSTDPSTIQGESSDPDSPSAPSLTSSSSGPSSLDWEDIESYIGSSDDGRRITGSPRAVMREQQSLWVRLQDESTSYETQYNMRPAEREREDETDEASMQYWDRGRNFEEEAQFAICMILVVLVCAVCGVVIWVRIH